MYSHISSKLFAKIIKWSKNQLPKFTRGVYKGLTDAEARNAERFPPKETKDYRLQHAMIRCRNPRKSIYFYTFVIGMRLLKKFDFPEWLYSLYFLGHAEKEEIPTDETERTRFTFSRIGVIELTHNWGSEERGELYHNGNFRPKGFGHIGIMVPNVEEACARFEKLDVKFIKKLDEGGFRNMAYIQDPDGYWIEIQNADTMADKQVYLKKYRMPPPRVNFDW